MQVKMILSVIVVTVVLGVLVSTISGENVIQREKITDFSHFPIPALPSAKVMDNIISAKSIQNSEYPTELASGHSLISVKEDIFYGETTLFYAIPEVREIITNDDTIQELVKKGVIVFDYEKIDNLKNRNLNNTPIFMTKNSNPVYTDSGMNGEYLTIFYLDENIRLSIYGNGSVDLGVLVKSLDL
ncbi:MAG: hypothetical protein OXC46_04690 [Thaumarchaeota archaeon]|nr:hypothetical protein [Nitrososphaerota archaeon]